MKSPLAIIGKTNIQDDRAKISREFTQKKVKILGKDTYYLQYGRKSRTKPTIVCLHGFLSDGKSLIPTLSEVEYGGKMIVPDLPGFGVSETLKEDAESITLQDFCDWFRAFVEKTIADDEPFVLIGYSFGAYVATQYLALTHKKQLQRCLLINPVVDLRREVDFYTNNFLRLSRVSERIATNAWRMQHNFTTLYLSKSYHVSTKLSLLRTRRAELEFFDPPLVKNLFERIREMDLTSYVKRIDVPLDIIMSDKDNVALNSSTMTMFDNLPNAEATQWYSIPTAGHLAPLEHYNEVALVIDATIRQSMTEEQ